MTVNILNLTPEELKKRLKEFGFESYRAGQILDWIFEKGVYDFDRMTNLSLDLRSALKRIFSIGMPEVADRAKSSDGKSIKLLLRLRDGDLIETVSIPAQDRQTICVSTQVGCKFHCAFCASGQNGFLRNLLMGEMVAQVLCVRDLSPKKKLTNIVFMGIGEPFDNYAELLRTIRTLNSKEALGFGARRMTISTCGVVPKIEKLSEEGLQVELSVSLHGPNNAVRGALMPVNRTYPVKTLVEACKRYSQKTKRVITFEYILIRGVNASEKEARQLARLLKGTLCKVNLIPYNPIGEFPHEAPPYGEIVRFQRILQEADLKATVRFSKGKDIQAACGQLRSIKLNSKHEIQNSKQIGN